VEKGEERMDGGEEDEIIRVKEEEEREKRGEGNERVRN
jgi:hypothetical protein